MIRADSTQLVTMELVMGIPPMFVSSVAFGLIACAEGTSMLPAITIEAVLNTVLIGNFGKILISANPDSLKSHLN
jgi:hypothetical protein